MDLKTNHLKIQSEFASKINFASQQNSFPVLKELSIENNSEIDCYKDLTLTLESNPPFLKSKKWRIDSLSAQKPCFVFDRNIQLDGNFLLNLADSVRATLTFTLECKNEILCEDSVSVEVLSYNEWGGSSYMPELLATFSMPNDPAIDHILKSASEILKRGGSKHSIEGYQLKSRERSWEIASAIYSAISNLHISCAEPPSSFESNGQKIRLANQIVSAKVATCLDTALLFSSAFEQAGLNSVIALPKGHALAGLWLQPEEFASIVIDDAETLRKRVQLNELVLFETTFVTAHPVLPFSKAVASANETLAEEHDATFNVAIDIKRARMHRILPLGLKSPQNFDNSEEYDASIEMSLESAPALPNFDLTDDEEVSDSPQGRIDRWQRKLLDLSLRNPLINFKASKTSLKIVCPDPGLLEDKLAAGEKISIASIPSLSGQKQDDDIHRQRKGESIQIEYAREALAKKQVLVDLTGDELSKRSVELYRKMQTALQEGGANTLFLAFGFLTWKRDDKVEQKFRAPLILLPVSLERQSVRSGIKLIASDDEPRFNTTLLEMLRKDFQIDVPGLAGELPTDASGIDVTGIWNLVRKKIKDSPGFEVVEDVVLGHFSFAKFLMWKDLVDRTDELRKNAVVKHLIDTPKEPFESKIEFVSSHSLDREYAPQDLLMPLAGDASQVAAIATADRGKDFIIIGPPGTGKSQTISNLIAHLIGKNKTVLFVSEKTAALEVVYRRLEKVGLGQFCLQLHSNKAKKADVLAQLRRSRDYSIATDSDGWNQTSQKLKRLQDKLNGLVEHMHKRYPNGLTPHYAIGVKVKNDLLSQNVKLSWSSSKAHDVAKLEKMRDTSKTLAIQASEIGSFENNSFRLVTASDWSPSWETQLIDQTMALLNSAKYLDKVIKSFSDTLKVTLKDQSDDRIRALRDLAEVFGLSYRTDTFFALEHDGQDLVEKLETAVTHLKQYSDAQGDLSCIYDSKAWRELDIESLEHRWQQSDNSWWLKKNIARWDIAKSLKPYCKTGKPNIGNDLAVLKKLKSTSASIDELDKQLVKLKLWKAHSTDSVSLEQFQQLSKKTRSAVSRLTDDFEELALLKNKVQALLKDGNELLAPEAAVGKVAKSLLDAFDTFSERRAEFDLLTAGDSKAFIGQTNNILSDLKEIGQSLIDRRNELRDWCMWLKRRNEAVDLDLIALVEAIENNSVPLNEISNVFEAAYCRWWSGAVMGEDSILRDFSAAEHTALITEFRDLESQFRKVTADYIAAKLSGRLTDMNETKKNSQWGVLNRELQKKTRHKPIRTLAQEIPQVLSKLAPCMMMSPLSVAQFLPANQPAFDVVIFDEASQITVWDAVGALARGRQVIVAGDPKQMPPTNFFGRSDDDPDGEVDDESDLESILDEMLGAGIPSHTLNLHYRSQRESLIAFSNAKYYDNALTTFPAPIIPDGGVKLIRPTGFYARGGAKHNEGEAKAIVAELVKRLTHKDEKERLKTLGVVTFNTQQQKLIEDLLDKARANNPGIEWAFSPDLTEPVFVKNLEAVQGDERDVILFSINYGPDQSGHVTMNFGPLNRTGGERRLNVALTRARSEMLIYSTILPEQIDLSRTGAKAVADLKHFLQYAEHGPAQLGAFIEGSKGDHESPLEEAIARALKEKGWQVEPQIGVSAFRIDLAVVHPDYPGSFLAGVECDGAMYHSSAFARERDKIRQGVLENLGWKLLRVWSTDWWTNKTKATEALHENLLQLLEIERRKGKGEVKSAQSEKPLKITSSVSHGEQLKSAPVKPVSKQPEFEEAMLPPSVNTRSVVASPAVSTSDKQLVGPPKIAAKAASVKVRSNGLQKLGKIVVVDVETTGVFVHRDRVIEIALLVCNSNLEIEREYSTLIDPERDLGSFTGHQITADMLTDAPKFREVAGDIIEHLRDSTIVGHNIQFDLSILHSEFEKLGHSLPVHPRLCTMKLAYALGPERRRLIDCCESENIDLSNAHCALDDARATLQLLQVYEKQAMEKGKCIVNDFNAFIPEDIGDYPAIASSGKILTRTQFAATPKPTYLASLIRSLPEVGDVNVASYYSVLDRVLEDRKITPEEFESLQSLAMDEGLSQGAVLETHRDYLRRLVKIALADGIVTPAEKKDLSLATQLLGFKAENLDELISVIKQSGDVAVESRANNGELVGCTVCFTGTFKAMREGQLISREEGFILAEQLGMIAKDSVTKATDILVLSDPDSMSSKAKKARQYGVRIMAERAFWDLIGVAVD